MANLKRETQNSPLPIKGVEAVIFDVGGVMLRTFDHGFRHEWDDRLGLPLGSVEQTVFNSNLGVAAQLGQVTTEDHWRRVGEFLGVSGRELVDLRRDFWAGDRFDYDMIRWIRSWRHRVKTAVISNAFDDLRSVLTEEFQVADAFDLIVVSAEERVMKPAAEIYLRTLDRLNCPPGAAVFIDDSLKNTEGAAAVGLQTIHFSPELDLSRLLLF